MPRLRVQRCVPELGKGRGAARGRTPAPVVSLAPTAARGAAFESGRCLDQCEAPKGRREAPSSCYVAAFLFFSFTFVSFRPSSAPPSIIKSLIKTLIHNSQDVRPSVGRGHGTALTCLVCYVRGSLSFPAAALAGFCVCGSTHMHI